MSNDGAKPQNSAGASGYFYTDLGQLDEVIGGWQTQGDDVRIDVDLLIEASGSLEPSPNDEVTAAYLSALGDTFVAFYQHTDDMSRYIDTYATKLAASRQLMAGIEDGNAAMFPRDGSA